MVLDHPAIGTCLRQARRDYFLILACQIQTSPPPFIDGGDLRPKQLYNPTLVVATVPTATTPKLAHRAHLATPFKQLFHELKLL
jgi:hypothetical protein